MAERSDGGSRGAAFTPAVSDARREGEQAGVSGRTGLTGQQPSAQTRRARGGWRRWISRLVCRQPNSTPMATVGTPFFNFIGIIFITIYLFIHLYIF